MFFKKLLPPYAFIFSRLGAISPKHREKLELYDFQQLCDGPNWAMLVVRSATKVENIQNLMFFKKVLVSHAFIFSHLDAIFN